jgi:hypothetical protein
LGFVFKKFYAKIRCRVNTNAIWKKYTGEFLVPEQWEPAVADSFHLPFILFGKKDEAASKSK